MLLICREPPSCGTLEEMREYLKWLEDIPQDEDDFALRSMIEDAKRLISRKESEER